MITRHFGSVAALAIKNVDIEKLPILALVYRLRGTTEIFQVRINTHWLLASAIFNAAKKETTTALVDSIKLETL